MVIETRHDDGKKKQKTLLQKLDIPVQHLDFKYVETCKDVKEIEKILCVLRSGEEGHYPEFEDYVRKRLEKMDPQSRYLRVETPAIRTSDLDSPQKSEIEQDIWAWLGKCDQDEHGESIFSGSGDNDNVKPECPIRGTATTNIEIKPKEVAKAQDDFLKPKNPNRIKSWDYDKWDKFNVDAELTKLEIEDLQAEEKRRQEIPWQGKTNNKPDKAKSEIMSKKSETHGTPQKNSESPIPSTSKAAIAQADEENRQFEANMEKKSNSNNSWSKSSTFRQSPASSTTRGQSLGPSFIEEISMEDESENTNTAMNSRKNYHKQTPAALVQEISEPKEKINTKESKNEGKRFKIIIEDLKIG